MRLSLLALVPACSSFAGQVKDFVEVFVDNAGNAGARSDAHPDMSASAAPSTNAGGCSESNECPSERRVLAERSGGDASNARNIIVDGRNGAANNMQMLKSPTSARSVRAVDATSSPQLAKSGGSPERHGHAVSLSELGESETVSDWHAAQPPAKHQAETLSEQNNPRSFLDAFNQQMADAYSTFEQQLQLLRGN